MGKAPPYTFEGPLAEALSGVADALDQGRSPGPSVALALQALNAFPAEGVADTHDFIQHHGRLVSLHEPHKTAPSYYVEAIAQAPGLQYLFLFHQDGYARQAALDAIVTAPPSQFFLAAILPRLNDWVPEVRIAAVACLNRILPLSDPDAVFDVTLALFLQSRNWARWTDKSSMLGDILEQPAIKARLVAWLRTAQGGQLARIMRTLLLRPIIDDHLYDLAKHASSASVRARALRVLLDGEAFLYEIRPTPGRYDIPGRSVIHARTLSIAAPSADELVALGLADKSSMVRKAVGQAVVARAPELSELNQVIDRLLADRISALRWRGDFLNRTMRR